MAEITYARKYRPTTLKDVVGNERAKTQLKATLKSEYRPQVILLQGPAGCGKTTLARIIAKEYCCKERQNDAACEVCDTCKHFDEFIKTGTTVSLMNLREYDCANVGKKEADAVIAEMQLPTLDGGWRVFIFDEAHLLTAQAMGALLKTLEEPVAKRLVVLCTTNPERLLETLRSRSDLQLTVEKQTVKDLMRLLAYVCQKEGIAYEDKALGVVAARSGFEPRTALKNLQAIVKATGSVTYNNTVEHLHVTTDTLYYRFFELCTRSTPEPVSFLKFLSNIRQTTTLKVFLNGLIDYVIRGLYVYNGVQVHGIDADEINMYGKLFKKFTIQEMLSILNELQRATTVEQLELQFVIWGYASIHKMNVMLGSSTDTTDVKDALLQYTGTETAHDEQLHGVDALNKEKELTQAEQATLMAQQNKELAVDDILALFGNSSKVKM